MKRKPIFLIAGVALFLGIPDMSYGYYQLLRFFICAVGAYGAYLAYQQNRSGWIWTLGVIALLFNPFVKFYLGKEVWKIVDLIAGIAFIISFLKLKKLIGR